MIELWGRDIGSRRTCMESVGLRPNPLPLSMGIEAAPQREPRDRSGAAARSWTPPSRSIWRHLGLEATDDLQRRRNQTPTQPW